MKPSSKRYITWLCTLLIACLIAAGCGSQEQTNTSSGESGMSSAEQNESESPQKLHEVTFAVGVNNLVVAPIIVANGKGYFQEEGIDPKIVFTQGSGEAVQALVGNSAQFAATGSGGITQTNAKGVELIAIESTSSRLTMDLVIRNEIIEKTGLSLDSPIGERFNALKGLTIGITSSGAATDVFTRYYLKEANLEPEVDTRLVTIGDGPSLAAALKQGQIDGFMLTPPSPQLVVADGAGQIFISGSKGDVPGLESLAYEVVIAKKSYIQQNPDITRSMARAVARGNNLILDHPEEALEILQQHFNTVEPEILSEAFMSVRNAIPRDGKMDTAGWEKALEIDTMSGLVSNDANLDTQEGSIWTNDFLNEVMGQSN